MAGAGGGSSRANVHAAWRMAVAERAAAAYAPNQRVAVFAVAGSVGTGLADRFSDLEVDCYWHEPPEDRDRLAPIEALGGQIEGFWEYDADEEEWSEDYRLGQLDVTVSNFLTSTIERWLDEVGRRADTDPVKHMRLAALRRSRPLAGAGLLASWRARAGEYPDRLVSAMVARALDPVVLTDWPAREALASRGDDLAVQALLTRAAHAVAGAVLALNRVYMPHRLLKWQRHLLTGLAVAPERLVERLELLTASPAGPALEVAEALLTETVLLAEARTDADTRPFREELARRRPVIEPPHPGP